MFKAIFIKYFWTSSIVGWIDIDTFYLFSVSFLEEIQGLEVLTIDHQTIEPFIEIMIFADFSDEFIFPWFIKMLGIEYEIWIVLEELTRERSWESIDIIDSKKGDPVIYLSLIGTDIIIVCLIDTIKCDTVSCLDDHLLFQEELLLEFFQTWEEGDDLFSDLLHSLDHRERCDERLWRPSIDIIDVEDLILDIKIELSREESIEILMDEVVKSVSFYIVIDMPLDESTRFVFLGRWEW